MSETGPEITIYRTIQCSLTSSWFADVISLAAVYDLHETITDTVRLGKAPMSIKSDLNYCGFKPVVSTVRWSNTCEHCGMTMCNGHDVLRHHVRSQRIK